MPEKESKLSSRLKFWGVVISAALSAFATILGIWIKGTAAKESSMKVLVEQLNDVIIPKLEQALDRQTDEVSKLRDVNANLRERLAKVETTIDMWKTFNSLSGTIGISPPMLTTPGDDVEKPKEIPKPPKEKKKFPRINVQQVLE